MTIHEALETLLDNVENGMIDVEEVKIVFAELEREPCEDAINRQAVVDIVNNPLNIRLDKIIKKLPSVNPQEKTGYCKDCKYFEYDSVAKVEGIPLIVAHEICSKWGNGCKTKEDGYCFLFEPQAESEET